MAALRRLATFAIVLLLTPLVSPAATPLLDVLASPDIASQLVQDPEMARIFRVGQLDIESLSEDEQIRFLAFFVLQFRTYEQMFQQDRMGLLDPEIWESRRQSMLRFFTQPGVQTMWRQRRHGFSKSFRDHLDAVEVEPRSPAA